MLREAADYTAEFRDRPLADPHRRASVDPETLLLYEPSIMVFLRSLCFDSVIVGVCRSFVPTPSDSGDELSSSSINRSRR